MGDNDLFTSILGVLAGLALGSYCAYWWVKGMIFYARRNWDFSEDHGPLMRAGEFNYGQPPMSPKVKHLFGLPFAIFVSFFIMIVCLRIAFSH